MAEDMVETEVKETAEPVVAVAAMVETAAMPTVMPTAAVAADMVEAEKMEQTPVVAVAEDMGLLTLVPGETAVTEMLLEPAAVMVFASSNIMYRR